MGHKVVNHKRSLHTNTHTPDSLPFFEVIARCPSPSVPFPSAMKPPVMAWVNLSSLMHSSTFLHVCFLHCWSQRGAFDCLIGSSLRYITCLRLLFSYVLFLCVRAHSFVFHCPGWCIKEILFSSVPALWFSLAARTV